MFEIGKKVIVITDKAIAYEAVILARAEGDNGGPGAYKVAQHSLGPEQPGQWHKASDVFLPEAGYAEEDEGSYVSFLRK